MVIGCTSYVHFGLSGNLHLIVTTAELQTRMPNTFQLSPQQVKGTPVESLLLFITDWAAQPPSFLGNVHTMVKRRKSYGHTSRATMIPMRSRFMRAFVLLFNHLVWASQEQLMNLGRNTLPYQLTSGMLNLLVCLLLCHH